MTIKPATLNRALDKVDRETRSSIGVVRTTHTGVESVEGGAHAGAVGDDGARQRAAAGVGLHEGVGDAGHAQRDQLLRGVDGAPVRERLADGDVLQQHDQRDHQDAGAQLRHHVQEVGRGVVRAHVAERRQLRRRHARRDRTCGRRTTL